MNSNKPNRWRLTDLFVVFAGFALSLHCQGGAVAATFAYDFEGLTNGALAGRDGWNTYLTPWGDCIVTNGPAGSTNTSKVLGSQSFANAEGVARLLPMSVVLDPANPVAEVRFFAYGKDANAYCLAGPMVNDNWLPLMGLAVSNSQLRTYLRQGNGTQNYGSLLTTQHWYEVRLVMDFSTVGGKGTLSYRDVTAGQVAFTTDSTFQNFPLVASQNDVGDYWIDSFVCRLANATGSYVDDVVFEAPASSGSYTAVSDSFNDGNYSNKADVLDVTWVKALDANLTLTVTNDPVIGGGDALHLDTGNNDPSMIIGYTPRAAMLGGHAGDKVRLSYDLRLTMINTNASNVKLRVGLYKRDDFDVLYNTNTTSTYNDSGYYFGMSVYTNRGTDLAGDTNSNDPLAGGGGYVSLTYIPGAATFGGFNDTTSKHTVVMEIVRWADGINGAIRLYGYIDGVLVCVRQHDVPVARAFDEIVMRAAAGLSSGVDQDFTVDNVVLLAIIKPQGSVFTMR